MGGDPLSSADLAADHDAVVVVLLRSHYCPLCREIVQSLAEEYQAFASRSVAVVPVLPDRVERGALWQRRYELPFPVLADPGETAGDEPSFDAFTPYQRYLQSLPGAVLFESVDGALELVGTFSGSGPREFPSVEELLETVAARTDATDTSEVGARVDS